MSSTVAKEPCCRRRGRPRMNRMLDPGPGSAPLFCPAVQVHRRGRARLLLPAEVEILRLVDLEGLQQEEAATVLGISRKTLCSLDLHEARRKVTDALVNGRMIEMAACSCAEEGDCPHRNRGLPATWLSRRAPSLNSANRHRRTGPPRIVDSGPPPPFAHMCNNCPSGADTGEPAILGGDSHG